MFRRNHLLGCCAGFLGLGLLIGHSFESGLLSVILGIGLICLGFSFLRQK